jgi:hypothetical protein
MQSKLLLRHELILVQFIHFKQWEEDVEIERNGARSHYSYERNWWIQT